MYLQMNLMIILIILIIIKKNLDGKQIPVCFSKIIKIIIVKMILININKLMYLKLNTKDKF